MVILLVVLEVFGQVVDALGQDRDLDFRRTGIAFGGCVFLDQRSLALSSDRHRMVLSMRGEEVAKSRDAVQLWPRMQSSGPDAGAAYKPNKQRRKEGAPQQLSAARHGVPDHSIIARRILQHGEMAGVFQDDELCARNFFRHHLGMIELYGLIMITDGKRDRQRNLAKLRRRPVRLRRPHPRNLRKEDIVFVRCRRQRPVLFAGDFDVGVEGPVAHDVGLDAVRGDIRRLGNDPRQLFRVFHRHVDTDDAAVRPSDERHLVDLQVIEKGDIVRCHQIVAERLLAARRAAVTAAVGDDDQMIPREFGDLVTPDAGIAKAAMDEEDRIAFTIFGIIHLDVVHIGHAACLRRRHGRKGRQLGPALGRSSPGDGQEQRKERQHSNCDCAHDFPLGPL
ncbi:hypothetical protein RHECNPAF_470080 [Rhizobium etli CNPAF512]|nr:hypothetical protein RHECNPAF_470080 [Rhizobium etli CNPAF512]